MLLLRDLQWRWWGRGLLLLVALLVAELAESAPSSGRLLNYGQDDPSLLEWMFSSRVGEASSKYVEEGRRRKDNNVPVTKQKNQGKRTKSGNTGGGNTGGYSAGGSISASHSNSGQVSIKLPQIPHVSVTGVPIVSATYKPLPKPTQKPETQTSSYPWWLPTIPGFGASHQSSFTIGGNNNNKVPAHEGYGEEPYSHKPTQTEVMVFSYPTVVKSFGKIISSMTKAIRRAGESLGDSISNTFNFDYVPQLIGHTVKAVVPIDNVDEKFPNAVKDKPTSSHTSSSSGSIPVPSFSSTSSLSHHWPLSESEVYHHGSISPTGIHSDFQVSSNLNQNVLHGIQSNINYGLDNINHGLNTIGKLPGQIYDTISTLDLPELPSLNLGVFQHHSESSFNTGGNKKPEPDYQANYHQSGGSGCC